MSEANWWEYDQLESGEPYEWGGAARGDKPWDNIDYHLDLGCGTIPKARLGIDRFYAPGVKALLDLSTLTAVGVPRALHPNDQTEENEVKERTSALYHAMRNEVGWFLAGLPFPDDSIESIISHHFFEHLRGEDAITLVDECHRVLKPGGLLRIIVPLFPSISAVGDLDHKSFWTPQSIEAFCARPDGHSWMESFSVPYARSRFEKLEVDTTARFAWELEWTDEEAREMRVALRKWNR